MTTPSETAMMRDVSPSANRAHDVQRRERDSRPVVCQVLHGLEIGGAEMLAMRLARQLGDRYRFIFACLDEIGTLGRQLQDDGFDVTPLGRRPGFDLRCAWRLARLCSRQRVDLVHAHQYTPFFYSMLARPLGGAAKLLFTEHGRFFPDYARPKRIFFNRRMLRRGDRVVAVAESVRQALVDNEGIAASRIEVIYNGIDVDRYAACTEPRGSIRRQLGVADDAFLVLQVARLDPIKDFPTALRAFARLATSCPNAVLALAGEGPERGRIAAEIERLRVEDRVILLGRRQDVPRLLAAADAFLLTSESEGIPLTVIEAMAAGVPVVSTSVGGVPEVVSDGLTGLLLPASDDAAVAAAITRLAGDPSLAARLAQAARREARQRFSEASMHAAYERIMQLMCDSRQRK